jgi:hypothetical protein
MQKSLDQMKVRVHRAVSDVDGATGMAILRAIVGGERDARELAQLRDPRCRKSEEEIAEQLSGHWREDHLFSLRRSLKMYDTIQQGIADYDREIMRQLGTMQQEEFRGQPAPPVKNPQKAQAIKQRGQEPMQQALYRMSGADLTSIDAIGVETVQVVLSEYGPDLSRFATEKEFVSHVTLAPHRPTSGGKPVKKKRRNSASTRVAGALRMAALSLRHSPTALGAYYRKAQRDHGGGQRFTGTLPHARNHHHRTGSRAISPELEPGAGLGVRLLAPHQRRRCHSHFQKAPGAKPGYGSLHLLRTMSTCTLR